MQIVNGAYLPDFVWLVNAQGHRIRVYDNEVEHWKKEGYEPENVEKPATPPPVSGATNARKR